MLSSILVREVIRGLQAYVETGFETPTPRFRGAFRELVETPGRFLKGPYLSLGLPFRRAAGGGPWFDTIEIGFPPYQHQARAWERRRPAGRAVTRKAGKMPALPGGGAPGGSRAALPQPGAAEPPCLGGGRQFRLDRIVVDVTDHCGQMVVVADVAVVILPLPDSPGASKQPVDPFRGVGLPGVEDVGQGDAFGGFDQDMDMIGHDAPGQEAVFVAIVVTQGLLDDPGATRIGEEAGAQTGIHPVFELSAFVGFVAEAGDTLQHLPGQGIGEPEGDGLDEARGVAVGEAVASVPAF